MVYVGPMGIAPRIVSETKGRRIRKKKHKLLKAVPHPTPPTAPLDTHACVT
jgi:hypothetical protein